MNYLARYFINLAISLDQTINTILAGDPDETLSSRAYRASVKGKPWGCYLCKFLGWLDKDHCIKNFEPNRGSGATFPDE